MKREEAMAVADKNFQIERLQRAIAETQKALRDLKAAAKSKQERVTLEKQVRDAIRILEKHLQEKENRNGKH